MSPFASLVETPWLNPELDGTVKSGEESLARVACVFPCVAPANECMRSVVDES